MKQILSLLLALVLCAALLAGCGKSGEQNQADGPEMNAMELEASEKVGDQPEEPFGLNKAELTLVTQGETWLLYDGDADLTQVVFSSEDESVATFFNGIVTAKNSGTTTVHADYNGQRYSCVVNCNLRFYPEDGQDQNISPYGTDPDYPLLAPPTDEKVDSSFFDDAVFIGDSATLKLSTYAAASGALGKAMFLTRGSYGVNHAVTDSILLSYQGQEMKVEEAVKATGAKKVFIMLGMNDVSVHGVDKTIDNWKTLIGRIQDACPDVKIYVQSLTPIWTDGETGDLTNENVDAYNARLEDAVTGAGCGFIDVAAYMKDATGGLAAIYCSDSFIHVTDEGAAAWIRVLKSWDY